LSQIFIYLSFLSSFRDEINAQVSFNSELMTHSVRVFYFSIKMMILTDISCGKLQIL
jgi:hypothetical protein